MNALALAALLAVPSSAAPKAPEFEIAKVLNAPVAEIKSLASLKGKVVFLEFWATWCGPCVAGMPRSNRLIEALKGEPFVFLTVTDEPADMIAAFLKTHESKAWIGIDEAKSSLKAYKVLGRPDGYLIGKDGTLLARIFPDHLQESEVRDAVAGTFKPKPVVFDPPERGRAKGAARAGAGKTYFELSVSSAGGEQTMSWGDGLMEGDGAPFAFMLSKILGVSESQIVAEKPPVKTFAFRLKAPEESFDKAREAMSLALQASFGFTLARELKETDVFLLSVSSAPGAPRPPAADPKAKSRIMANGGGRLLGQTDMPGFAKALWEAGDVPVFDETGLKGEYALDLEWKRNDGAARALALAAAGLRLVPGRRKVEFVTVVPAKTD